MDALLAAPILFVVLFVVLGLAATLGVDSRDGFADDRVRQAYR
jgi:hypothetical protein